MRTKRLILATVLLSIACIAASAQPDKSAVRQGNRRFRKGDYPAAGLGYRKGLVADSTSFAANYNLANTLYRENDFGEAGKYMEKISGTAPSSPKAADYYFNVGDIALKKQDYKGAVEAFMRSLLINPDDLDAKENYIYARKMLENQQNNGGGGGGQDQNQDQNNQDQNQDQNNQGQNQDQNNQDQNQDQSQDQNQDNQDQNKDNQNQNQDQNQDQNRDGEGQGISSQQAQQMLQAIQAKEAATQDKVNKEKAAALKSRQKDKNW